MLILSDYSLSLAGIFVWFTPNHYWFSSRAFISTNNCSLYVLLAAVPKGNLCHTGALLYFETRNSHKYGICFINFVHAYACTHVTWLPSSNQILSQGHHPGRPFFTFTGVAVLKVLEVLQTVVIENISIFCCISRLFSHTLVQA